MFSLYHLDNLAKEASKGIARLNSDILRALGKRIALAQSSGFDRFLLLTEADKEADALYLEILRELGRSTATAGEVFSQAARLFYESMNKYYAAKGLTQIPIEQQRAIVNFVNATASNTKNTFMNLSNTSAIGFRVMNIDGSVKYEGFKTHYHNLVDQAIAEVGTGNRDYSSAIRNALKQTADSGIRVVDYQSGYSRRLDSAMRQNVLDGVRDIAHEVSRRTGEEFGADGVEIDAHNYCAPDHLPYQGRQYKKKDFEDIQNSLPRPFETYNCRHTVYPILLGISEPLYTEDERQAMIAQSTEKIEFEGKQYTRYEATQLQRRIETSVRQSKDRAIIAKASGDDLTRRVEQLRINQLKQKYGEITNVFKTPPALDRMSVSGFRQVRQTLIKPEQIDFAGVNKVQHVTNFGDQRHFYPELEPGRRWAVDAPVHLNNYGTEHLLKDELHSRRIGWLQANSQDFVRGIHAPEFIESKIRLRRDGHYSVTNIVKVSEPGEKGWEYMATAISLSKTSNGYHQITTIHQLKLRDLFYANGVLKPKYSKVK